MNNPTVDI